MLLYLERVFGDPNKRANAEYKFQILHQEGQEFNTFWAEFLRLSIKLDRNESTLISDLTFKISHEVQQQLINGDEPPTDLFKYAERCQRVYQGLKDLARAEALEESMEQSVVVALTHIQKVGMKATIRTAKSSRQLVISEKNRLMKEGRYFLCREVGHRTMDCPNKKELTSEQKSTLSKLTVSRMAVKRLEQEESRAKASQAEVPHAEESPAEKPLIVLSFLLSDDFFAEEALLTLCTLENDNKIETIALLDTGATG